LPPVPPKQFDSSLGTDHRAVMRRLASESPGFLG